MFEDCNCFVSVMKVDAYYVPHFCLLILIKFVYEIMCGGTCTLVGVTRGGSCGASERSSAMNFGILPYFVASLGIKKNTMLP